MHTLATSRINSADRRSNALRRRRSRQSSGALIAILLSGGVFATAAHADVTVTMHKVSQEGITDEIGNIKVSESEFGLVFTPELKGLSPGVHGFHVHQNPSCDPLGKDGKVTAAGAAGGHYDPENAKKHASPWGDGHLGDLPALYVDAEGNARLPVLAPRLTKLDQIKGRALMVHEGGDNYSDHPMPLGGGGGRMACGVIR